MLFRSFERHLTPAVARSGLAFWAIFAKRPRLYRLCTSIAMRLMALAAGEKGLFASLPFAKGWTQQRDLPAPQGRTFQEQWQKARGNQ